MNTHNTTPSTNIPVSTVPQTTDPETDSSTSKIVHATEASFDEIIKEGNVVVDFWAEWCGPCHRIAPMVEELSEKYAGKIKFVKVDIDANPGLSEKYGIYSIPNLYFFKDSVTMGNQPGAYPLPILEKNILLAFNMKIEDAASMGATA